jgi:hypothetical protein
MPSASSTIRTGLFLAASLTILLWFYARGREEGRREAAHEEGEPPNCPHGEERGGSPSDVPPPAYARSRLKDPGVLRGFEMSAREFASLDAKRSGSDVSIGARRRCYAGMMRSASKCMQFLYRSSFSLRNDLDAKRELLAYSEACERYFDARIREAYATCYTSADETYPLIGMRLSQTAPRASNDVFV